MNRGIEALINYFSKGCKEERHLNIGLEVEHFVLNCETKKTMVFDGEHGIAALMQALAPGYPEQHTEDGAIVSLGDKDVLLTLEPGCQFEISPSPSDSVEQVMKIYRETKERVQAQLTAWGYELCTQGYLPYGKVSDIPLIPKERYRCMDRHFQTAGIYGRNMMRATAACHVSVDYFDEKDFVKKYRLAWLLNPIFALLTENVTQFEGEPFNGHLLRDTIWQGVDNARTQVCPDIFDETFGFESYARWLVNVPVILVSKDGVDTYEPGRMIGDCFDIYGGDEDLVRHYLSMVFPDIRLKQFLEIRSADSMPEKYVRAYCALIKGVFGNESTILELLSELPQNTEAIMSAKQALKEKGYQARVYGQDVRKLIKYVLDTASGNLEGTEKDALKEWYILLEVESNIQGVAGK